MKSRMFGALLGSSAMVLAVQSAPGNAQDLYIGGQVRQGISLALDPPLDGNPSIGPSQFTVQLQSSYNPVESITMKADLWLRGDWFYDLNGGHYRQPAIQNAFTGPPFLNRFHYNLSESGPGTLPQPFGNNGKKQRVLSNFDDDIIRQLSIAYAEPSGAFTLTVGKFQRGWGQADGLRLLDVLYPQDLRQRTVFTDTEDLRLPAWSAALDVNLDAAGLSAPFDALGMKNASLEFVFIPEVRHTEFVINNPTPSSSTNGGLFGFPFPRLIDPKSGFGIPLLGANLHDVEFKNFHSQEIGARLKFNALGGEATINGFYGYQDLPIVELTGSQLIIGNALNDPNGPGVIAVVPLDVPSTIGAVQGPGGFLDFLRSIPAGTAAPGQYPLFLATGGLCNDILVAAPNCSINGNFDLNYKYRQKLVGASFTRDIVEMKMGPKGVSPVLRLEASYEFEKPFNRGRIVTPTFGPGLGGEVETGSPALITTVAEGVTHRDVLSLLVGFDYNLWLWPSQEASMFITTQFFNIHTGHSKFLLAQAPYAFDYVEKNQNYLTQTWTLPIRNESITFDGLLIWDIDKHGLAYRQRVDFVMMGGHLKPRLEYGHFSGRTEGGLLGAMKNGDYLEFSLAYQF
ncbi:MAG: hypothetical protein JWN69_2512 [Alphaproteobacteria bacterium]|nr:hypothetical protein [Alphaproteobacteria bacterium]